MSITRHVALAVLVVVVLILGVVNGPGVWPRSVSGHPLATTSLVMLRNNPREKRSVTIFDRWILLYRFIARGCLDREGASTKAMKYMHQLL